MASYRLSDELPDTRRSKPPWSPLGLFFLTFVFLPLAVPFWFFNWPRLGHGEKRLICAMVAMVAVGILVFSWVLQGLQGDNTRVKFIATLAKLGFAYFQLNAQRPLYEAHLNRGGAKAPAWPLWVAAVVGLVLIPAVYILAATYASA